MSNEHLTIRVKQTALLHSKLDSIYRRLPLPVLSWQVLYQARDQLDLLLVALKFDPFDDSVEFSEPVAELLDFAGTNPSLHGEFGIVDGFLRRH